MQCGIYKLLFTDTKSFYIGKSVNISKRITCHKSLIKNKTHYNTLLNAQNLDCLVIEVLGEYPEADLAKKEVYWADLLKPDLNIAPCYESGSGGCIGIDHGMSLYSEEQLLLAVRLLAQNYSYIEIQDITDVHYQTIAGIVASNKHYWIEKILPEEYKLAKARKRPKPTYIVRKDSIEYSLTVPKHFCEEHNINYSNFVQMLKNKRPSCSGFTLVQVI